MPDRSYLLFVILFSTITFYRISILQDVQYIRHETNEISSEAASLATLLTSTYGTFHPTHERWLDIIGLTHDTGFAWDLLPPFHAHGDNLSRFALGDQYDDRFIGQPSRDTIPFWRNLTGITHGRWKKDLQESSQAHPNVSRYGSQRSDGTVTVPYFGRNLTGDEGTVTLRLEEDEDPSHYANRSTLNGRNVTVGRFIAASLDLESTSGGSDSWSASLQGVHFTETGHALLSTKSNKLSLMAIPHIANTPYFFAIAQQLIGKVVNKTLREREPLMLSQARGFPEFPKCELIIYLQQLPSQSEPVSDPALRSTQIALAEKELRAPSGANVPALPGIEYSMVGFSPDCGYMISSEGPPLQSPRDFQHVSGVPFEVMQRNARHHFLLFTAIIAAQLWLLIRQIKEATTPALLNRISFPTAGILVLGDGISTILLAGCSALFPGLWVLIMAGTCLGFLRMLFGAQLLLEIWAVQAPEYESRDRSTRSATAPTAPTTTNSAGENTTAAATLPLPVTATRTIDTGVMPVFMPSDGAGLQPVQESANSHSPVFTGIMLVIAMVIFMAPMATQWPSTPRRVYFSGLAMLYLSFWSPQIFRNAVRNCRHALRWEFVIGQSILRFIPIMYFFGYKDNALSVEVQRTDLAVFAAWLWLQCVLLGSQQILGPRWLVTQDWLPPVYDYHAVLRNDGESGNLPIGSSEDDKDVTGTPRSEDQAEGSKVRSFDCAICMQSIEAPVLGPEDTVAPSILIRSEYMLTPCRHIFHTKCLESWMKFWHRGRLPCPICREELPTL